MTRFMMALAAGSLLISGSAMAQSARTPGGFYVGAAVGAAVFWDDEVEVVDGAGNSSDEDVEYDAPSFSIAGQIGYFMSDNIRLEAELSFASADGEIQNSDIEVDVTRGTVSAYYDFNAVSAAGLSTFRPYVGAGVGFANIDPDADDFTGEEDSTELSFHGEGGATIDLSPNIGWVSGVRLEYTGESKEFDSTIATVFKTGLRYAF